jgi:hypothetical protein
MLGIVPTVANKDIYNLLITGMNTFFKINQSFFRSTWTQRAPITECQKLYRPDMTYRMFTHTFISTDQFVSMKFLSKRNFQSI